MKPIFYVATLTGSLHLPSDPTKVQIGNLVFRVRDDGQNTKQVRVSFPGEIYQHVALFNTQKEALALANECKDHFQLVGTRVRAGARIARGDDKKYGKLVCLASDVNPGLREERSTSVFSQEHIGNASIR